MFFNGLKPSPEKCCGCTACKEVCPKNAISWIIDDCGFSFPEVNPDKCIECGVCEKVCPMLHANKVLPDITGESFAAVNKDIPELKASSSGGIFSVIARHVLDKGGIVYGAAFDEKMQLSHIGIERYDCLSRLQGSKYLQSQNGNVYSEIRKVLNEGRLVYYVGTGCQVAGLKLFLRKEYPNLVTSDILCHGVPPQKVFDAVIEYLQKNYNGKVIRYLFRDKSVWGWSCSSSSNIKKGSNLRYVGFDQVQDGYFNAFIKAENYRESCYVCPYARSQRSGDITLADFWGVEKYLQIPKVRSGVSAILINTDKGQDMLLHIKNKINLYNANLDDIRLINKTLEAPTPRPSERDDFFKSFQSNPVEFLKSFSRLGLKKHLVYLLKRNRLTSKIIAGLKQLIQK